MASSLANKKSDLNVIQSFFHSENPAKYFQVHSLCTTGPQCNPVRQTYILKFKPFVFRIKLEIPYILIHLYIVPIYAHWHLILRIILILVVLGYRQFVTIYSIASENRTMCLLPAARSCDDRPVC